MKINIKNIHVYPDNYKLSTKAKPNIDMKSLEAVMTAKWTPFDMNQFISLHYKGRTAYNKGDSLKKIKHEYGVSKDTVYRVLKKSKGFTKLGNIRGLTPEEQQKSFYKTINEQLDAGGISLVEIDIALNVAIPEAVISLENPSINHPIGQLTIRDTGIYVLKNLNIENLALPTRSKDSKIFISNCNINHIHCSDSNYPFLSLYISDSVVSKFEADGNTIQHLEVRGGSILNFICPGPGEQNPFMGDVIFDNVFFPRTAKIYPIKGPQAYKNVRHHLRSNNNELSANEIHSAELSLEREFDTSFFNKFASILYELISDFGKATLGPYYGLF